MKIIGKIKIGGLQSKIFNLMLIFILALIGIYAAVSVYQQRNLTSIVQEANTEQQASITAISEETMKGVLDSTMVRSTALQAYIADDLFADVKTDVMTLHSIATQLFEHENRFSSHPFYEPNPANDGIASVQMQHEEGVNPWNSEALGLVANMSEVMLAMFENSDKLSSCFVATPDGCILFVDDRAGTYVSEDGFVYSFPVRERPWYRQAVEAGELIYTGVERDAFTGIAGLVCAAPVYRNGELVAVVGADIFLNDISDYVMNTSSEGSFLCVISGNGQVLFSPVKEGVFSTDFSDLAPDLRNSSNEALSDFVTRALKERTGLTLIEIDGTEYYLTASPLETLGWTVVTVVEKEITNLPTRAMLENYEDINNKALSTFEYGAKKSEQTFLVTTLIVILLALGSALLLAARVVKPLEHMTKRVRSLGGDELQFAMEKTYRTGDEIEVLAESFAALSAKTVQYIGEVERVTAEKERIGTELALAQRIQADMLPNIYPAFPDRSEFDIYATMDPAKEVGGDFYDFFLIDNDHLCMVMADVSGKGVPAALFMMASRIILANNAMMGKTPAQILTDTNVTICSNNREEMFVTAWLGILEISTGKLTAANAGHEYPAIRRANGTFELYKDKHGLVIGAMEFAKYKQYELQMHPGDRLFLYTDGVPEATNERKELFGTDRMLKALNENPDAPPEKILRHVRSAVDAFVQEAEQFDDLTMLGLEYKGKDGEKNPSNGKTEESTKKSSV